MGARLDYKERIETAHRDYYAATAESRKQYDTISRAAQSSRQDTVTTVERQYANDLAAAAQEYERAVEDAKREHEAELQALKHVHSLANKLANDARAHGLENAQTEYTQTLADARIPYDEAEPPARDRLVTELRNARYELVAKLRGPVPSSRVGVQLPPKAEL